MNLNDAGAAAGAILAILACVGFVWRRVLVPLWRVTDLVTDAAPVLVKVADQFRQNGGSSLIDKVDRLAKSHVDTVDAVSRVHQQLERVDAKVDGLGTRFETLDAYTHEFQHAWKNSRQADILERATVVDRVEGLDRAVASLKEDVAAIADLRDLLRDRTSSTQPPQG